MIDLQTEKRLIQSFVEGNKSAGDELVTCYYPKLMGLALKVLKNSDDAQDVIQDVLVKVFAKKKIRDFRGDARLGSWMYRIMVNECKTLMSKRMRHQESTIEWLDSTSKYYISTKASPEESYKNEYLKNKVRQTIDQLDNKYQIGLKEIYYEDKTYKEASKKLNLPMHTLGVRIMRGKQMLTDKLESLKWQYDSDGYNWIRNVQAS